MKKIAFGAACGLTALFVIVILLTSYGRNARSEEADSMLSQAADSALSHVMSENNYEIKDNHAFIADFLKMLLVQADSDSDLKVSILEADYQLGILSVEITEKFKHPNGREGSVSNVRTVIFDKAKEQAEERKTVGFYVDGRLYKEYCVKQEAMCTVPVTPQKKGKEFLCWRFVTGGSGKAESIYVDSEGGRSVLGKGGTPYTVSEDTKLTAVFQ